MKMKQFYTLFFLVIAPFQMQVAQAASPTDGLAGQWLLDENSGTNTVDQSGNSLNLTLNNDAGWIVGQAGSALNLNGTDQSASIANATVLQTPSITLSAWIYPNSNPTDEDWIAAQGDSFGLFLRPDSKSVDFYIKDTQGGWSDVVSVDNSIVFDQWQHVAGSFDASSQTLRVYVDGVAVGTSNFGVGIEYNSTGNGFTIGSMQEERYFDGRIDEVHVYDRALSGSEIQQLAGGGGGGGGNNNPTTLDIQVDNSSDDAEEYSDGSVSTNSSDLELTNSPESSNQTVGIRFDGVALPAGAVISNAYIQFQTDETDTSTTSLTVFGEANANPAPYTEADNNITNRTKTTARVNWNPLHWNNVGNQGVAQRTANLTSIIQELVDQGGWNSGQAMAFIIEGSGQRTAESFDGSSSGAPTLHIELSTDNNPAPTANFTANPTSGDAPLNVSFDGSASTDDGSIASYGWTFGDNSAAETGVTVTHNYTNPGNYNATLTITDDEGKTTSITQVITVSDPNAATIVEASISSGSDDAEQRSNNSMYLGSTDLELVTDQGIQHVGLRFNNLNVPVGSTITSAYIQFQADETDSGGTSLTISGEANDNPTTFTSSSNNIGSRPLSNANVAWNPPAWNATGARGVNQRTADISGIVQELINRGGWNSGQSMAFIITGSGNRTAESFEGSASGKPTLHIEYSTDGNPAPIANISASPVSGDAPLNVSFDGSASTDDGSIASYGWTFGDNSATEAGVTVTHNYTNPGTYNATLTVTDDGGKTTSVTQVITVSDPNAATIVEASISSGSDDAEQRSNNSMYLGSTDLELVTDQGIQHVGLRFNNLNVPVGSTITSAYIQFQADETNSGGTSLTISGEANDNPTTFTSSSNNIGSRPLSNANVAWNPAAWNVTGARGVNQRTADISSIVQELINRGGWNSGQSMAFIITGSGNRTAESFEGSASGKPTLHIEYSTDGNPAPIANISASPISGNAPLSVNFDGSGSTDSGGSITNYSWLFGDGNTDATTGATAAHDYTSPGIFTATLTVTDDQGKTGSITQVITVIDPDAPSVLNVSIASGADDAEQRSDNRMYLNSTDLELVTDGGVQQVGLRFNGLTIPATSTITNAYIQFQVDEANSGNTSLSIQGEATGNPTGFTSTANNIGSRPLTSAIVSWNPASWNAAGIRGPDQRTPDLSNIIQELVNQDDWDNGNSMVFVINGSGKRTAESFEGSSTGRPILHIEYSTSNNPGPVALFTATPTTGIEPLSVFFDGTGSTDDSTIASYAWAFGNGTTALTAAATATYSAGTYIATLTVTDDEGKTDNATQEIVVSQNTQRATRILPLGDSITNGGEGFPSYRRSLWFMLRNENYNVDFIGSLRGFDGPVSDDLKDFDLDHEGHWAWEAGELEINLSNWLNGYTPDIVLLHAGTNDVDRGQSHSSTISELDSIIDILRNKNPSVVVLVAKIIPMQNRDTADFNAFIESFVALKNTSTSPVVIVDQHAGYNPSSDNHDNYHPNFTGEEKMATRWLNALKPYLN